MEGDIDLYYRWQETEQRDSVYRKAYERYIAEEYLAVHNPKGSKSKAAQEPDELSHKVFWQLKDYDKAFYIGFQLEEKLAQVSESDYPARRVTYYNLSKAYYLMLDFHRSIELLEAMLVGNLNLKAIDQTNALEKLSHYVNVLLSQQTYQEYVDGDISLEQVKQVISLNLLKLATIRNDSEFAGYKNKFAEKDEFEYDFLRVDYLREKEFNLFTAFNKTN